MISENTATRNKKRKEITDVTWTLDEQGNHIWDGKKRTPNDVEVKEYHAKLSEIAKSLYKHNIQNMMKTSASNTAPGIKLVKKYVWGLAEELETILEGVKGVSNLKPLVQYANLQPNKKDDFSSRCKEIALMGLSNVLNSAMSPETNGITGDAYSEVVKRIGKQFVTSLLDDYKTQENRMKYENTQARKKDASLRSYKPKSMESIKIEILGRKAWSDEEQAHKELVIKSGAVVLNLVMDMTEFATIEKRRVSSNSKYFRNVEVRPEVMEEVTDMISQGILQADYYAPDADKPRPWNDQTRTKKKLVRNSQYCKYSEGVMVDHVAKMDKMKHTRDEMPEVFEVLDIIESTEWTVDAEMIQLIKKCIDGGVEIPGINEKVIIPPKPPTIWDFAKNEKTPRRMKQDETQEEYVEYNEDAKHVKEGEINQWWESFYFDTKGLEDAFKAYRTANAYLFQEDAVFEAKEDKELAGEWHKAYKKKVSNDSKCAAGMRSIETAEQLVEYEKIYFAHNLDTRGRVYPIATSLNPQLNDVSKGLLKFSEGDLVDEEALGWLEVNIANNWANEVEIELTDEELMNEIEFIQQFV